MRSWTVGYCTSWHTMAVVLCDVVYPRPVAILDLIVYCSLTLFLIFFPRLPDLPNSTTKYQYTWRTAVGVALICLVHGLATIIISAALFLARPHLLGGWANLMGICATILAAIQYLPQIWMTYTLGHVGSLSIPMMLIQTPGAFLWAGSLAARLGMEGWSTWGIFLVTGCLQGCLLVMGIYFELRARREAQSTEDNVSITLNLPRGNIDKRHPVKYRIYCWVRSKPESRYRDR